MTMSHFGAANFLASPANAARAATVYRQAVRSVVQLDIIGAASKSLETETTVRAKMSRDNSRALLVSIGAVSGAVLHVAFPTFVPDAITAGFVALAILPWLAPLIKSVEIPGVGKLELQEVRRDVLEAKGAALSAGRKADLAVADLATPSTSLEAAAGATGVPPLDSLAGEYNRIRQTQQSGPARTEAMTSVVRRMIDASRSLDTFDIESHLRSKDGGKRLAGYAYLYSRQRPDAIVLTTLVDSVVNVEDKPFGQYWGLQAARRMVGSLDRKQLPSDVVRRLREFKGKLAPGTDRYYELTEILSSIDTVQDIG